MNRLRADYWVRRGLPPARRELLGQVFISHSSDNESRNGLVRRFGGLLKPVLELAGEPPAYVYSHPVGGSRYGVSFVDEIVERIAHARAGFVFKSAEYRASQVCELELQLLLWRNHTQGMPLYFIYAGASSLETLPVSFPVDRRGGTRMVCLGELGDDRKAHPDSKSVAYLKDQSLQMLLDEGKFAAVDTRLLAIVTDFARTLKLPAA
jgi:hypothetical protein